MTSRVNPKDIDVSIWVSGADLLALSDSRQRALQKLFGEGGMELFSVDSYLVPVCEPDEPLYEQYVEDRDWTREAWATARDFRQRPVDHSLVTKGYVEIVVT